MRDETTKTAAEKRGEELARLGRLGATLNAAGQILADSGDCTPPGEHRFPRAQAPRRGGGSGGYDASRSTP